MPRSRAFPFFEWSRQRAAPRLSGGLDDHVLASVDAESSASGVVQVGFLEAVGPLAFVILFGEVAGAGSGEEGFADGSGVFLVPWAPGRGRDVHDVSPPLLVLDGGDAVDHVGVPPDGVAGIDVGDAAERLEQQWVPFVVRGEDGRQSTHLDPAHCLLETAQRSPTAGQRICNPC